MGQFIYIFILSIIVIVYALVGDDGLSLTVAVTFLAAIVVFHVIADRSNRRRNGGLR